MNITLTIKKAFSVKYLEVQANVRYWEDGEVDEVTNDDGALMPCRKGDAWCPEIDVDSGQIVNWQVGKKAKVHYKVCDDGRYILKDSNGNKISIKDGYVPGCLCPQEEGYGDYIIMNIDERGFIEDWDPDSIEDDFKPENED